MGLSFFDCQRSRTTLQASSEFGCPASRKRDGGDLVEPTGLEPVTSGLQSQRSPN